MKDTRLVAALLCALAFGAVTALKSRPAASPKIPAAVSAPKPAPKPAPLLAAPLLAVPLLVKAPAKPAACDASKCNGFVAKYYKEINCKPVFEKDACCPARFDCPAASARAEDKCYLAGVAYSAGASIPNTLSGPCTSECICKKFADKVNVHCLTTECDDVPDNCVPLFKENACCAHSVHCKNASKVELALPKKELTCTYGGATHLEGELLRTPSDPCKICSCQKGFNGTLAGSWCRERSCDLQLLYGPTLSKGCAPVFYGDKECCPASWRCPSATDKVIPGKKTPAPSPQPPGKPKEALGCVFGDLRLGVGDALSPSAEDEECTCSFPPHVTCARREVAFDLDLIDLQ